MERVAQKARPRPGRCNRLPRHPSPARSSTAHRDRSAIVARRASASAPRGSNPLAASARATPPSSPAAAWSCRTPREPHQFDVALCLPLQPASSPSAHRRRERQTRIRPAHPLAARARRHRVRWARTSGGVYIVIKILVEQDAPVGASPAHRVDASDSRGVGRNDGAVGHHIADYRAAG